MAQEYTIDQLLNHVPERPDQVQQYLSSHPSIASQADNHGYSLLHAATSYNHAALLRDLITTHAVSVDITDEDGESPLFAAETVEIARLLVEELGANATLRNTEGQTAAEKLLDEGDTPLVAAYLNGLAEQGDANVASVLTQVSGQNGTSVPSAVPNGISDVRISTQTEVDGENGPDPELRRRIEELAARDDFHGEAAQGELRNLVHDAISGMQTDSGDDRSATRRRID